jgi:predicted RNase H-like nuclease (RuvC/YqgF family)
MPITFSPAVRESWGEAVADEVARTLDEVLAQRTVSRDEWRDVIPRLERVEESLDTLGEEVSHQRREIGELREEMSQMRREMNKRFDAMSAQFNDRLDQQATEFNERLDQRATEFNKRLDAMQSQTNERLDAMNEAMRVQTRWTTGAIIIIGAILSALISIAEFAA